MGNRMCACTVSDMKLQSDAEEAFHQVFKAALQEVLVKNFEEAQAEPQALKGSSSLARERTSKVCV